MFSQAEHVLLGVGSYSSFLTEGEIGVLPVSSLFQVCRGLECMCVYVCACYTHTHTLTAHGVLDTSPGLWVGTMHLEGPKNPNGLNLGIFVFVLYASVYKVHICIYVYIYIYKIHLGIYVYMYIYVCNNNHHNNDDCFKRVLKDFRWFIRHHSSVMESAALKKFRNP